MKIYIAFALSILLNACTVTSRPTQPFSMHETVTVEQLINSLNISGALQFTKVVAANWAINLSGLIDLKDPQAKAANLDDIEEAIQIYFYVIDHPQYGRFLIDSGIESRILKNPDASPVGGFVSKFMNIKALKIHQTTQSWIEKNPAPIKGLFFTHLHLDHIMGIPDIDEAVPIYLGPQEVSNKLFKNAFVQSTTDKFLSGDRKLFELQFPIPQNPGEPPIIDFFGDRSLFIISVPGHTKGSLAFVINSAKGPQLVVGDTSHTRWGWENNVTPGTFSEDLEQNKKSLDFLKSLAKAIPGINIHLGHQSATAPDKLEEI